MQEQGYISVFILLLPLCNECVKSCWSLYLLDMCAPFSSTHNWATWPPHPPHTLPRISLGFFLFLRVYICACKYNWNTFMFLSLYMLLCCHKRSPTCLRHRRRSLWLEGADWSRNRTLPGWKLICSTVILISSQILNGSLLEKNKSHEKKKKIIDIF